LNVAETAVVVATPVALLSGLVELTIGGVVSAPALVVNVHTWLAANAFPATSVMAVVSVAVYVVLLARSDDGVNVAIVPAGLRVTVPVTPPLKVNEAVVTVAGASGSLNVAVSAILTGTPVAPLAGVVELTVGGVVSAGPVTVKELVATLSSPWLALLGSGTQPVPGAPNVAPGESYAFPYHAAVNVYVPGVMGAVPVKMIWNCSPPPNPLGPELRSTSTPRSL
jgi:hypothetical protein